MNKEAIEKGFVERCMERGISDINQINYLMKVAIELEKSAGPGDTAYDILSERSKNLGGSTESVRKTTQPNIQSDPRVLSYLAKNPYLLPTKGRADTLRGMGKQWGKLIKSQE